MVVYLAAIFVYAAFAFAGPTALLKGASIVALYSIFDLAWTRLRDKVWYFPLSSLISGLVLAIVAGSDLPILAVVLLPLLAVFSKQLLHFDKMRHVFNPAAFAMTVVSFFIPVVSWWATGWNNIPLMIVSVISVFILWRQKRWHVAVPFFFAYSILLSLFLLLTGVRFENLQGILTAQLLSGTLLFFSTVMLIEPMTSTFPTQRQRIIYGFLVALFSIIVLAILRFVSLGHFDSLIVGLLGGNLAASFLFLPKRAIIKKVD